jgi:hypothetical protein|tara:strand:+ start:307 stop:489 length:183 start_codon:yes stop_codon:yes gene_type:complete
MLIQIIGIAALVIVSYFVVKRLSNTDKVLPNESEVEDNSLIFEEEMSEDELNEIDESIND